MKSLSVLCALAACHSQPRAVTTRTPYLALFERGKSWTLPTTTGGSVTCQVAEVKQVGDANVSRLRCNPASLLISGDWVATPAGLYHPLVPIDEPDELALLTEDDLLLTANAAEREHEHVVQGAQSTIHAFMHRGSWCVRETMVLGHQERSYTLCFNAQGISGGDEVIVGDEPTTTTFGDAPIREANEPVAVLIAQQEAWNRGDLEGYMAGYLRSDELVFTSGGNVRRGWQETHDKYKAKYGSDPSTMGKLAFDILGVQSLGDEGAIVLGRWKLTDTPNAGGGVFSVALRKTPDGWRVIHDHTSSDAQ